MIIATITIRLVRMVAVEAAVVVAIFTIIIIITITITVIAEEDITIATTVHTVDRIIIK